MKTLIRIKRRADEEPVENILVKPKRARFCEIGSAVARAPDVQPTVLERVATVESKEEELELNVFKKEKVYKKGWELREQYKKPHKLEGFKASARREAKERESYKRHMVHASHRGNLDDTELGKEGGAESKEDEDKELHAEGNKKDAQKSEGDDKADDSPSVSPPHEIKYLDVEFIQKMDDVITCNGEPMQSEKYVYDIYYSPDNVNWTEYACDIQKYMYDSTDETLDFDDEDDENAEDNWRNDYPDEEDDDDSSFEDEEDYLEICLRDSSSRDHKDDSFDEALYEDEDFDAEGNLIYHDNNPVLTLRRFVADIRLQSDSEDD